MTMKTNLETSPTDTRTFRYGTISCGADTYSGIWTKGTQVFTCDDRLRSTESNHHPNFFRTPWKKYGHLDLLVVTDLVMDKLHHEWINIWGHIERANCLLIFHKDQFLSSHNGSGLQRWCKLIRGRGYDLRTQHLEAVSSGAAIWSRHTVSFCFPSGTHNQLPTLPYRS